MGPRMISDPFSVDIYCCYLNTTPEVALAETGERHSASVREFDRRIPVLQSRCRAAYMLPRLFWMGVGPGLMMLITVLKLESRTSSTPSLFWSYAAIVGGILLVRWVTYLLGDRCDSFGRKTGLSGLACFTGLALFSGASVWMLVSLMASQIVR